MAIERWRSIENFFPHYIHECDVVVAVIWRVICLYCECTPHADDILPASEEMNTDLKRVQVSIQRVSKGLE